MTRLVLISSILRRIWIVVCFLLTACVPLPVALAQHPGHVGVGGHIGSVPRVAAPHVAVPPRFSPSPAILPPRFSSRPSFPGIRTPIFRISESSPGTDVSYRSSPSLLWSTIFQVWPGIRIQFVLVAGLRRVLELPIHLQSLAVLWV
jgi:hypothetical protein